MNTKTVILLTLFVIVIAGLFLAKPLTSGILNKNNTSEKKASGKKNKGEKTAEGSVGVSIINKWEMPAELTEISGLAWIKDDLFACVQDEDGTIFIFNAANSKVEKKIDFAGPGDYEGIAVINDVVYVMRADGVFFRVDNINAAKPTVKEFKTHLTVQNDVQGFTYDKKMNRLLAAMKGDESGTQNFKGIYAIDPVTNTMSKTPVFRLSVNPAENASGKKKKNKGILPSEISVHPLNNDLYIVDAGAPGLKILNQAGEEKGNYTFNKNDFPQPEGITFSPDGRIFISNEGKKGMGNIVEVKLVE